MPAINSDVPIGYRMKGEEMLSFMRQIRRMAGASFPERRESSSGPKPEHECACSSPQVRRFSGSRNPGPSVSCQHNRSRSWREPKPSGAYSTFVLSAIASQPAVPIAEADDVARMVEYLLGDGGQNISRSVLTVDAGSTA